MAEPSTTASQTPFVSNGDAASSKPRSKRPPRRREDESPDVQISKTLSYILRHGAAKEGLRLRPDGFVRVDELVRFAYLLEFLSIDSSPPTAQATEAEERRCTYAATDSRRE